MPEDELAVIMETMKKMKLAAKPPNIILPEDLERQKLTKYYCKNLRPDHKNQTGPIYDQLRKTN